MRYRIRIDDNGPGCVVELAGSVRGSDLRNANQAMYARLPGSKMRWQLWDLRQVTDLDVSAEDMRLLAVVDRHATSSNPCQRCAVVGSRDVLGDSDRLYGIYATVWTEFDVESFEAFDEAYQWSIATAECLEESSG